MSSFREEYYSNVDELFTKLRTDPFQRLLNPLPQEEDHVGSIQPVGWVRNAGPDGTKSIEINIDGLAFWNSGGQRVVLRAGSDDGEVELINLDGSNDDVFRLVGETSFETWFAARLSSDTEDRIRLGIDSSDVPTIEFGAGGASAPDISLSRGSASRLHLSDGLRLLSGQLEVGSYPTPNASQLGGGFLELRHSTPFIDFSNDNSTDFHARVVLSGDDTLAILGANLNVNNGGIQFAGGDILDQYDEGSWTPTIGFETSNGNLTVVYSTRQAVYTRIGNLVFWEVNIVTSTFTHTTASGNFVISGLPFASANNFVHFGALGIHNGFTLPAGTTQMGHNVLPNDTKMRLYGSGTGSPMTLLTTSHAPTGTNKTIRASGFYVI